MKDIDRAKLVITRKRESLTWLETNYWGEWEEAFRNYKSRRSFEKDQDGKDDPELSHVGSPLTWSYVNRTVARGTAQPPNLRYHSKDSELSEMISRTLMYQWDKARIQRLQKKHFRQAVIFGWSVKAWYWAVDEFTRSKRVDVFGGEMDPATLDQIVQTYQIPPQVMQDPMAMQKVMIELMEKHSRGRLLPVKYNYRAYEGPKCDFLFVGDCYPEPNFESLQSSNYFIVERRRNKAWLEKLAEMYPALKRGVKDLFEKYPKGTQRRWTADQQSLRNRMLSVVERTDETDISAEAQAEEWTITEMHSPGPKPKLCYVGEDDIWVGEPEFGEDEYYPYDLDGKIAFTECVLVDDLLGGIGDSVARVMRGLHMAHERQFNRRLDLIYNILRPLLGTSNRELLENPDLIKRHAGFRMVYMRGPGDLWVQGEQAAMASAAASLQDEAGIMRLWQMMTGESNMSSSANVDPQQTRTATGARLMAFNQDVLTKDLNDMFAQTSLTSDAEIMYLLNRSELADAIEFESSKYNRIYSAQEDSLKHQWIRVEPMHFQTDGEIVAESGSTLADDDDTRVVKSEKIGQIAFSRPDLFNQHKARDDYLIAMGKGRELPAWAAPPPPPPPPPEVKTNASLSIKWTELSDEERAFFMSKIQGVDVQMQAEGEPEGGLPPGMPMPGGPGGGMPPPAPPPPGGMPSAVDAARGRMPQ